MFHQFYETKVFPFPVIDWQIDDHWKLTNPFQAGPAGGAGLELNYAFNERWEMGIGGSYRSYVFRLSRDGPVGNGIGREQFRTRVPARFLPLREGLPARYLCRGIDWRQAYGQECIRKRPFKRPVFDRASVGNDAADPILKAHEEAFMAPHARRTLSFSALAISMLLSACATTYDSAGGTYYSVWPFIGSRNPDLQLNYPAPDWNRMELTAIRSARLALAESAGRPQGDVALLAAACRSDSERRGARR